MSRRNRKPSEPYRGDVDDPLRVTRYGRPPNIAGLWAPAPAFLACSGPSLGTHPLCRLRERGVVSLGVNLAAAWAPVKAWVFSDPQTKFHSALFLDPAVMTFAPEPKLRWRFYVKTPDGYRWTSIRVGDCPNTYGYSRKTQFVPETFFDTAAAHWGPGKHQPDGAPRGGTLCTMMLGLRLLYYLGVRTIYLLGVDFRQGEGGCYAFPSAKRGRKGFKGEVVMLEKLLPVLQKRGVALYNTNRESSCGLFPYRSFNAALEHCKGDVPDEPLDTFDWYDKKKVSEEADGQGPFTPANF